MRVVRSGMFVAAVAFGAVFATMAPAQDSAARKS